MLLEQLLGVPLNIIILCLIAGAARIFIASEAPTVKGVTGVMIAAILLSIIVYPVLVEEEYSKGFITLLVAIGSFGGKDILLGVLKLYEKVKNDPLSVLRDYLNWRKGQSGDKDRNE